MLVSYGKLQTCLLQFIAIIPYVFVSPGTEVFALPNGSVSINKGLKDISEQIKPYIRDLIDHSNMV